MASGQKYIMRSEVMFARVSDEQGPAGGRGSTRQGGSEGQGVGQGAGRGTGDGGRAAVRALAGEVARAAAAGLTVAAGHAVNEGSKRAAWEKRSESP